MRGTNAMTEALAVNRDDRAAFKGDAAEHMPRNLIISTREASSIWRYMKNVASINVAEKMGT